MGAIMDIVVGAIVEWVLPALAAAIGTYVLALLHRLLQRYGLQLTAEQDEQVRRLVRDAIRFVEERARSRTMTGAEKQEIALHRVLAADPTISTHEARERIQTELPAVRAQLGDQQRKAPKPQ